MPHAPTFARIGRSLVSLAVGLAAFGVDSRARADEQLWALARGAETLPKSHAEFYQFATLRTGKNDGDYYAYDFESELEYGITNEVQASLSIVQHYFDVHDVEDQRDQNRYRFGGVEGSVKGRLLSPFIDPIGLALRAEGGYLAKDDVGGIRQQEWFFKPEVDLQKNFLDDTLVFVLNGASEFAWGKQPAEEYPRELSLEGATGVSWRFAPNWFAGVEGRVRSEWPKFDFDHFEHFAFYTGPSLHYGAQRWWVTASWLYQAYGQGIGEGNQTQTFAEETTQIARIKVGINF
ncbi:MAG TPA: DUF6662 family protein [Myxococcota bacterium]|nr:DUF6662 family protein [Myxococcota bacterium]